MEATFTPHSPDNRTPEQQAMKHCQHQERRGRNKAGHRRARRREWPTRHGPPAPGYISRAWLLAEERYLHRYGLPLPDNWHAKPSPQIPKLNTGGDHRHPLAMHIAYNTANSEQQLLPYRYWQNRMEQALALELEACQAAPPERQPYLMRSAAHLAAMSGWPSQARVIRKQAEMRFPKLAGKLNWPTLEAMNCYEGARASREDATIATALRSIATVPDTTTTFATQRLAAAATAMLTDQRLETKGRTMWQLDVTNCRKDDLPLVRNLQAQTALTISQRRPHWTEAEELGQAAKALTTASQTAPGTPAR